MLLWIVMLLVMIYVLYQEWIRANQAFAEFEAFEFDPCFDHNKIKISLTQGPIEAV